jgi:two-component system NarL family response regulator
MTRPSDKGGDAARGRAPKTPIKILIADDHRSFGEALQIALDKEQDLTVIEVVGDGAEAVRSTVDEHPDVVLMDLQMPLIDGIEATRKIREEGSHSAVIILSGLSDDVGLARAVQAGARGYLPKTAPVNEVAKAIRQAYQGKPLHDSGEVNASLRRLRTRTRVDQDLQKRVARLTPREIEILQLLAEGRHSDRIADDLGMSRHTLRTHMQNILTKLAVHTKTEAVIAALRFGKVHMEPSTRVVELPEEPEPPPS